ncbi:MAG: hypothetical protein H6574_12210 [Lewinellaceae bacterium]|nr:hypothetical protein [Lewinellaceae bacterium]
MKNQDQNHAETPLVTAARAHVLQLWNTQHDARLVFHNFAQAAAIAEQAGAISRAEGLPESDRELVQVAAWFHNVGYLYEPRQVAETSAIRAEFFMVEQKCAPEKIEQLRQTIMEAVTPNKTELETARVLHDAIRAYDWAETYDTRGPLLQLEQELLSGHAPDPAAWLEFVRKQLQEPF